MTRLLSSGRRQSGSGIHHGRGTGHRLLPAAASQRCQDVRHQSRREHFGWLHAHADPLRAEGAGVDWHDRLPDGAHGKDKNANQKWSAYIKRIHTRPGGRKKRLDERPDVAPLDHSAILRHHGVLPTRISVS